MKVAIIMGSLSDKEKMSGAAQCLTAFDIEFVGRVLSAHRVPKALHEYLMHLENNGCKVIIAGAGCAAHLPGVIASQVIMPVIGVPLDASLDGMDALLSIVQMPKNIPVASVAINNSFNAAMLAVEILAVADENLQKKLREFRSNMEKDFLAQHNTHIAW